MNNREISDRQYDWLASEMESWSAHGLLSERQGASILALYGTPQDRAERRGGRAVATITSLAAALVGLGALSLVAFNWAALSPGLRLALIVLATAAAHGVGWHLRFRLGRRTASNVLFLLGCLFYGGAIWQTAQAFNITVASNAGFWWWAVGSLPIALASQSLALHALVVVILAMYTGAAAFGPFIFGRGSPIGTYDVAGSVPLLALPGLIWAYRRRSAAGVGLYVVLLTWWVVAQPAAWRFDEAPIFWIGSMGALLLLAAECHPPNSDLAIPHRFLGVLLVGSVLFLLSFYDFNRGVLGQVPSAAALVETAASAGAAVGMVALAAELERRRQGLASAGPVGMFLDERRRGPLALVLLMAVLSFWNATFGTPLAPTIAANVAALGLSLWLILAGLRTDRGRPFLAGVLYFLGWAVCRYFDLFGNLGGMLGAALMFFLCGAALFGVARFWQGRNRREVAHV